MSEIGDQTGTFRIMRRPQPQPADQTRTFHVMPHSDECSCLRCALAGASGEDHSQR